MTAKTTQYADDDTEPVKRLLRLRLPPLFFGLFLGLGLSFATSTFEDVLSKNVAVVFFIPFVVYLASAVGTQTQSIYARDLRSGRADFRIYFVKETALGVVLGLIFSIITAPILFFWFQSAELALAVFFAVFGAVASAPLIALLVTEIFQLEHADPAVGAGPIATVIQDAVSIVIYGSIVSAILL